MLFSTRGRAHALIMLGTFVLLACGRSAERDAPPEFETTAYEEIDRSFQPLRRDFEGEAGRVRLVVVATSTCGYCVEGIEAVFTHLVPRFDADDLVVIVLWARFMPGDTGPRTARAAEMFVDPRVRHYFDPSGRIARAFGRLMGLDPGQTLTGAFLLYGPDDTWDPQATMMDEPEDYNALLEGWLPRTPRHRMGQHSAISMPALDLSVLEQQIMALLSEQ